MDADRALDESRAFLTRTRAGRSRRELRALPRQRARPGVGVHPRRDSARATLRARTGADRPRRPQPRRARDRRRSRASSTAGSPRGDGAAPARTGAWLLNPGSVGQPRDGDPRAAWLLLDTALGRARFNRVRYDVAADAEGDAGGRAPADASRTGSAPAHEDRLLLVAVVGLAGCGGAAPSRRTSRRRRRCRRSPRRSPPSSRARPTPSQPTSTAATAVPRSATRARLRADAIAAINDHRVPGPYQETLLGRVQALEAQITCTPPAPVASHDDGKHKGEHKHEKKHGHGDGGG